MGRKHITQMTKDEKGFIHGFIRSNIARVSGQSHFYSRADERHFTLFEAMEAIACGLVIEVHDDRKPDIRAVVRHSNGTCAVLSLTTWQVITVYYNDPSDQHSTLDWNTYRWPTNLVSVVKRLHAQL